MKYKRHLHATVWAHGPQNMNLGCGSRTLLTLNSWFSALSQSVV